MHFKTQLVEACQAPRNLVARRLTRTVPISIKTCRHCSRRVAKDLPERSAARPAGGAEEEHEAAAGQPGEEETEEADDEEEEEDEEEEDAAGQEERAVKEELEVFGDEESGEEHEAEESPSEIDSLNCFFHWSLAVSGMFLHSGLTISRRRRRSSSNE